MQEVFEKIIEGLKELEGIQFDGENESYQLNWCIETNRAIEIVKQEAKQYNNAIIDGKYCFQSCACTEKCDKCNRLCNGDIDWYENIDNWTEEYSNDWIPCSEQLPDYGERVLLQDFGGNITLEKCERKKKVKGFTDGNLWSSANNYIAWQPLPQPYTNGE